MSCSLFWKIKQNHTLHEKIKFVPPKKPNYKVGLVNNLDKKSKNNHGIRFEIVDFNIADKLPNGEYRWITRTCYLYKKSLPNSKYRDKKLVILHVKTGPFTILLSHGMSSDLGSLYPFLVDFCTQMKCDIISYDYSGYGCSEGNPSENRIISDIEEVASFAKNVLMIKPSLLMLFGISIGSIPTIHLGSHSEYAETIKSIILLSPYSRGLNESQESNDDNDILSTKINMVKCPICLIHGKQDMIIPYENSEELASKIRTLFKWFPSRGNHTNITVLYRYKFYMKLKKFIDEIIESFNDKVVRVSYQLNMMLSPKKSSRKKIVIIEENYVENGNAFDVNLIHNQKLNLDNPLQLFEIIPEENQINSDGECSYRRNSKRSIINMSVFNLGEDYDTSYYESDRYFSDNDDDICNNKKSIKLQKSIFKSPYISPIKSPLKSPMKQIAPFSLKKNSPLIYPNSNNLLKKRKIISEEQAIIPQTTKNSNSNIINLQPISDFPDME